MSDSGGGGSGKRWGRLTMMVARSSVLSSMSLWNLASRS